MLGPASPKQEMILQSDAQVTIIGGAAGCFLNSTEYLTPTGWKRFDEFTQGDLVAQYDPDTDLVNYVTPLEYIKKPCSTFTRLKGKGMQMTLSDEHTVLYWNAMPKSTMSGPKTLPFHEVKERHDKSKTKGWMGKIKTTYSVDLPGIDWTEAELRLQVMANADGSFSRDGKDNYCRVSISKDRKRDRLIWLCEKFGIPYRENDTTKCDRYVNGKLYNFIVWPKSSNKRFNGEFWNCSQEQLDIIADEVGHWDGSIINSGKTKRFFSKHKEDCDFIQHVFASQGMNTSIVKDGREFVSWTTNGAVHGNGFRSFANKDRKNELEGVKSEDGFKYCFSMPSGFLLVREDNKIFLTGNSGKSYLLQMIPLRYVDDPRTTIIMFRRTNPQIKGQGGIFDTAVNMYRNLPVGQRPKIRMGDMTARFPNGATMKWSGMEHVKDKYNIQGLQFTFIGVDEACQFEWEQLDYMMSRLRSESKYPSRMVMSCNPDSDHKIREMIEWHLDEEGYPIQERDGIVRYFIRIDGDFIWGDTIKQLKEKYGPKVRPLSFTFISATIYDNPPMREANPDYEAFLEGLGPVDKAQLLHGNWNVRAEGANYFKRDNLIKLHRRPLNAIWARGWDKASQEPTIHEKSPDYTAGVKLGKCPDGFYYLVGDHIDENVDIDSTVFGRFRKRPGERDKIIAKQGHYDGADCHIVLPIDPGAAGKVEYQESAKKLLAEGLPVKVDPVPNNKNKLSRFEPFASAVEAGLVRVIPNTFSTPESLNKLYDELEKFDGTRSTRTRKDDFVDSIATAFNYLCQTRSIRVVKRNQKRVDTLAKDLLATKLPPIRN